MNTHTLYEIQKKGLLLSIKTGEPVRSHQNILRFAKKNGITKNEAGEYLVPSELLAKHNARVRAIWSSADIG